MRKTAQMLATKSDHDGEIQTEGGDKDLILVQPLLHPSTYTASQNSAVVRIGLPKDIYNQIA